MTEEKQLVIFDFPGPLGSLELSTRGEVEVAFQPFAESLPLLQALAPRVHLGLSTFIEQLDHAMLRRALVGTGLTEFFDPNLWTGLPLSPTHLRALAAKAAVTTEQGVLVSHEAANRLMAREVGLRVAPDVALLPAVLEREPLRYVRVDKDGKPPLDTALLENVDGFVILHVERRARTAVYGIAGRSAMERLCALTFKVTPLCSPDDTAVSALALIQSGVDTDFLNLVRPLPIVEPTADGLIIAVPGDRSIGEYHPVNGEHGHTIDISLAGRRRKKPYVPVLPVTWRDLTGDEIASLQCNLACADIDRQIHPLIGNKPLDGDDGPIISSRSYLSPENGLAAHHVAGRLGQILGTKVIPKPINKDGSLNVVGRLSGKSATEVVVVGAHIDSVAMNAGPKVPAGSLAPGADDDGSGVAGVLAVAHALRVLAKKTLPERSIELVLFNEEEVGMGGSRRYTYEIENAGVTVVAMLQMDMIGYHRSADVPQAFEIHAPGTGDYANQDVVTQATVLRDVVAAAAKAVAPQSLRPQIYPEKGCDSDLGRYSSDHDQFLMDHWPACLVAEDFWLEACAKDPAGVKHHHHPGYHKKEDTFVCCHCAAEIARVVAAAAWMIANGTSNNAHQT